MKGRHVAEVLGLIGIALAPFILALTINWDDRVEIGLFALSGLLTLLAFAVFSWPELSRVRVRSPFILRPANPGAERLRQLWESSAVDAFEGVKALLTRLGGELRDSREPSKGLLNALVNNGVVQQAEQARAGFTNPFTEKNELPTRDAQEAFGDFYYRYVALVSWMYNFGQLAGLSADDHQFRTWAGNHNRFMEDLRKLSVTPGFETLKRRVKEPGSPQEPGDAALTPRFNWL